VSHGQVVAEGMWDASPVEPPRTRWQLPDASLADRQGLVAVGADLQPGTLLAAYRGGLFPMPVSKRHLGWWSPDPRGIIPLDGLRVSRSLRRSCRNFTVTIDQRFREVMTRCGDPRRPHGWITREFIDAYDRLHRLGWGHSVEVFDATGALVGGLYGLRINRLFAGESMFHDATDASKVALVALVERMRESAMTLLDVQWATPHLSSLGAIAIPRTEYLARLAEAV
jgi:leucyl/phenylalanyl-tRNA--protein transferase